MTTFQEIYDNLKAKIIDYSFIDLTIEQENELLGYKLKSALSKFVTKDNIFMDMGSKSFNRNLEDLEIEIITYGLLCEWLSPKIYNIEILEQRLSSNEFKQYSQANHLGELINLKKEADNNFHYWMRRFDLLKSISKYKGNNNG